MRKNILCIVLFALLAIVGCKKGNGETPSKVSSVHEGGSIVATVGGEAITVEDLKDASRSQMQQIEMKIYQIEKRLLDELVDKKLIEIAAKKEDMTAEEYIKKMVYDKVVEPREEEVRAIYDSRAGNTLNPYEEMKIEITAYLKKNQEKKLEKDLIAKLRAEYGVKTYLNIPRAKIAIEGFPSLGSDDAVITLVEFSDYQCPFSGRVRDTIWELIDLYKGKVRYVYRDFPLSFHRDAKKAHEAAHCAGEQGKYFEYNKELFINQKKLGDEELKKYAKKIGLDMKKFNTCLESEKYAETVDKSVEEGVMAGVTGTPAFFINGIMVSGAQPLEVFKEIIDNEIATKK